MATTFLIFANLNISLAQGADLESKNDKSAVLADTCRLDTFYQHNASFSYMDTHDGYRLADD